ncbi:transglutaminase family protein [Candidatus Methylacidithermus pantelleriae]|uniref:TGc domain-containing protein n=1 Tax=Candidatus Methylacidithermus pantelleriae TaxID=2744239 RepID=A0A8J2BL54_9BACT|nr:transglutaminase family protein [Candidatus Methylacidithermus pantelleriae]CAF0702084.1 TGc domain-containing protein [Candidatus Methylacidithermus pantelleriae]
MRFHIVHWTEYVYSGPALESYMELRVRPRNTSRQVVWKHRTELDPRVALELFTDYFGNWVEFASIPFRHERLTVVSRSEVETRPVPDRVTVKDLTVSQALSLCRNRKELYEWMLPSRRVPFLPDVRALAEELLPSDVPFFEALWQLSHYIGEHFSYEPGATDVTTPLEEVLVKRKGVCQDFAHVLIAIARARGLPARYVSGYIEPVGAGASPGTFANLSVASHAWAQVYSPAGEWIGLDPTNQSWEGTSHVQIAVGRDYWDVAPLRGIFKGASDQKLSVRVSVERLEDSESQSC